MRDGVSMPRHCYLILSHRNVRQIARLTGTLLSGSPGSEVVVCHDVGGCVLRPSDVPGCRVVPTREHVRRSEWSLAQAYLDAVSTLAELGVEYEWLTYISGQDYPIRPLREYEAFVEQAGVDGFMTYGDVLGPDNPFAPRRHQGRRRYYYRYRRLPDAWQPWLRRFRFLNGWTGAWHLHWTYGAYIGTRVRQHPFTAAFRCYAGSMWHTLNRRCVEYLRTHVVEGAPAREHFTQTMVPDEAVAQTFLVNSGRFTFCRDNLRFVDSSGSVTGSPRVFGIEDFERLVKSGKFFARKFDMETDAQVLGLLDERMAQVESAVPDR